MKIELHCHTSRYSACAVNTPEEVLAEAVRLGYHAVFLTEHDALWPEEHLGELEAAFPDIRVFGGVELTLPAGEHLLVLGTSDPEYLELSTRPSELLSKARNENRLTILAHPCRWSGRDEMLRSGLRPDAIEYRTGNQQGDAAKDARNLAMELSLPIVNAGDVHALEMMGQHWIETHDPIRSDDDIRPAIVGVNYRLRSRMEP
ncbi:MAG: PHP domain-containing protein [Phycisphaerae bacterium]